MTMPRYAHSPEIRFGASLLLTGVLNWLALYVIEWQELSLETAFGVPFSLAGVCGGGLLVSFGIGFIAAGIDKAHQERKAASDPAAQR